MIITNFCNNEVSFVDREPVNTSVLINGNQLTFTVGSGADCGVKKKNLMENQVGKKTDKVKLRWIFQCFQGIHLVRIK